jgi:hypothetical protein
MEGCLFTEPYRIALVTDIGRATGNKDEGERDCVKGSFHSQGFGCLD